MCEQVFIEWITITRHGRPSSEFCISLRPVFMCLTVPKWVLHRRKVFSRFLIIKFVFSSLCLSPKLINDAFELARYAYSNYEIAIDIAAYLQNEIEYAPWSVAFKYFERILPRFKPHELHIFEVTQDILVANFNWKDTLKYNLRWILV